MRLSARNVKSLFSLAALCLLNLSLSYASAAGTSIYIAVRTDGLAGTGSQTDPYDGSTEVKFDALMKSFPENTQIHLGAGTYSTLGWNAFGVRAGWNLQGAGMGVTTLKLMCSATEPSYRKYYHLCGFGCDGAQISNLTCDGNYQGQAWPANDSVGGICPFGNNVVIDSVEFINCYGDTAAGLEQFCICMGGLGTQSLATGCVVRNCVTHHFAAGANYTNGVMISYSSNGSIINCTDDGANHAFGFSGQTSSTISGCTSSAQSNNGFYTDTGSVDGITIDKNSFSSRGIPIQFNSREPATNVTISNNALESSNSTGVGAAAIVFGGGSGSDFTISGNVYTFNGTGWSGLILNNSADFTNLDVVDNSSNVGLIGAGGKESDVTSVATTFSGNNFNLPIASLTNPTGESTSSTDESVASGSASTAAPSSSSTTTPPSTGSTSNSQSQATGASTPASTTPTSTATTPTTEPTSSTTDSVAQLAKQVQNDTDTIVQQQSPTPVVVPAPVHKTIAAPVVPTGSVLAINRIVTNDYSTAGAIQTAQMLSTMPAGAARKLAVAALIQRWAADSPATLLAWLSQLPAGSFHNDVLSAIPRQKLIFARR